MNTMNLQQRLNNLFGYIRQGKVIESMNEFYDKDTVMHTPDETRFTLQESVHL